MLKLKEKKFDKPKGKSNETSFSVIQKKEVKRIPKIINGINSLKVLNKLIDS